MSGSDAPEQPLTVFIPSSAIVWTLPAAMAFVASHIASDDLATAAELAGFGVGFTCGVLIARRAFRQKPAARQVGLTAAGACAIVIAIAVPVRGIADVKPEIARVIARRHPIQDQVAQIITSFHSVPEEITQIITRPRPIGKEVAQVVSAVSPLSEKFAQSLRRCHWRGSE